MHSFSILAGASLLVLSVNYGQAPPPAPAAPVHEMLDTLDTPDPEYAPTADTAPIPPPVLPAPTIAPGDTQAAPPRLDSLAPSPLPKSIPLRNRNLKGLDVGGRIQLKAFSSNIFADQDADKSLSLTLRRASLDLKGAYDERFGFISQFRLEANAQRAGISEAYLYYRFSDRAGIKAGKLKRPISQESLRSSKELYTVERGALYHEFLANTTGYIHLDLGLIAYGGFVDDAVPVGYEFGIFNGKQNDDPLQNYAGQHYESTDKGFKAKDFVMRLTASPLKTLSIEGALSTKTAEDRSDPFNFEIHFNTAYQLGFQWTPGPLRILGEMAWGDNHQGRDSHIISGSSLFFTSYLMSVWRREYSRDRASELILKWEGLDPDFDFNANEGMKNDGKFHYTLGSNYFFNPHVSLQMAYTVLHPITKVESESELTHGLEAMWRMGF